MNKNMLRARYRLGIVAAAVGIIVPLLTTGLSTTPATASPPSITSLPRNETVYTSGTAYSAPTNWNPLDTGNYATGTEGLLYETLFNYNPVTNKYVPWLAQSGSWNAAGTSYTINLRSGIQWSDGTALTSADVAYTINLAKNPVVPYSNLGAYIGSVTTPNATTVVVNFSSKAYTEWQDFLWQDPIVQEAQFSAFPAASITTDANATPIGSGPMTLLAANSQEVAYQVNPNWWGTAALGLSFKFKYLVDVVNGSNNVEFGNFLAGNIDLSNNFLAGIASQISSPAATGNLGGTGGFGIETYYSKAPYMLSANTVWLEPNLTKAPMNNLDFRKALAYAINTKAIAKIIYGNIVNPTSATGLLPNLNPFISKSTVKKYGFTYNQTMAKKYLKLSNYKGQNITIQDPDGWTDWNSATDVIVSQLAAVGIKATAYFPQDAARNTDLISGNYDLALDNNAGVASTPWTYFDRVFQLPIAANQSAQLNWERDNNPAAWALVQKLGTIAPTNTAETDATYGQLEKIFLQTLPEIPLWYNGAWAQYSTQYWLGWPTSKHGGDTPIMWDGWLGNMTTVEGLAGLYPNPSAAS